MDLFQIISVLGLGSLIGIGAKHFLDKSKDENTRIFEMKRESYTRAIGAISGLGNKTVHYVLTNSNLAQINPILSIQYLTELEKELAPAILVSDQKLRKKLKEVNGLILDFSKVILDCIGATKKEEGQFQIKLTQPEAQELKKWKEKLETFEKEMIEEMRKELSMLETNR